MAIDIEKLKTDITDLMDKAGALDLQIDAASLESKRVNAELEALITKRTGLRQKISDKLKSAKLLPEE